MISLTSINLMMYLKNKQLLSQEKYIKFKEKIKDYVYPMGAIPTFAMIHNQLYSLATLKENVEYFDNILNNLYNDIYTKEEIEIIKAYLITICYSDYIYDDVLTEFFSPFVYMNSEKLEIKYCLEEIKFRFLQSLMYNQSNDDELINKLFNELEPIEQSHNAFVLTELKLGRDK